MKFNKIFWLICLGINAALVAQDKILDSLITEAIENNLQLHAYHHQVVSEKIKIRQVTAWEAPEIGVEFYETPVNSFPFPTKDSRETDYFIQQTIPWPGKLSAMGKTVENTAKMREENYRALEQQIIKNLKYTYYELYLTHQKISINAENQRLLQDLKKTVTGQIAVGYGKQQDLLRLDIELSKLQAEAKNLLRDRRTGETMMNTILNRDISAPVIVATSLETEIPYWQIDQLLPIAMESRAELSAMKFNLKMFKAEQTAAKKEFYPDIMLRTVYKEMSQGKDFWSLMVGVNLPFAPWSKSQYAGKVLEADQHILHGEKEIANMQNMIAFDVQKALSALENNRNLMLFYRDISIPQYDQTLKLLLVEYQSGKIDFGMVVDMVRMQLMARLDYQMAVMNFMNSLADLELAVGLNAEEIKQRLS